MAGGSTTWVNVERWRGWWPTLKRVLTIVFFVAVAVLLVTQARQVEWREVAGAIRAYDAMTLLAAAALAALGHLLYAGYDLLARRYTGHGLAAPRVIAIAFVSYTFNLNLGPLIGAMALRFRLYSGFGIRHGTIARVLGFSIVSNWLGYLLLGGALFAAGAVALPEGWALGTAALQVVGVGMVVAALAYLAMCGFARRRSVTLRGYTVELPPVRVALLQLLVSCASWTTIGTILFVLLGQQIAFPTVLGVMLVAAVAALLTHIPAGLGVLEATFVVLLGHLVAPVELLAAVLTYRAAYYLMPLLPALLVFGVLEARRGNSGDRS